MKTLMTLLKSVLMFAFIAYSGIVRADQPEWISLRTSIKCKIIEAELVSTCHVPRKFDEPAVCKSQALEFHRPDARKIVLFEASASILKSQAEMIGRHAHSWFCSSGASAKDEILTLNIADWFNTQHEDVFIFNKTGRRLTGSAAQKIANTREWREASASPETKAIAYGRVVQPSFK